MNDFWAGMNVSQCGLHRKTYRKHQKRHFGKSLEISLTTAYSRAAAIVKELHKDIDPGFFKDVTVVYDGS